MDRAGPLDQGLVEVEERGSARIGHRAEGTLAGVDPAVEQEIREAYAAFAAGDVDRAMSKFFAPDAA